MEIAASMKFEVLKKCFESEEFQEFKSPAGDYVFKFQRDQNKISHAYRWNDVTLAIVRKNENDSPDDVYAWNTKGEILWKLKDQPAAANDPLLQYLVGVGPRYDNPNQIVLNSWDGYTYELLDPYNGHYKFLYFTK